MGDQNVAALQRGRIAERTLGEPIVMIEDVEKSFGDNHVLKQVSLTVHQGEVVVICGALRQREEHAAALR